MSHETIKAVHLVTDVFNQKYQTAYLRMSAQYPEPPNADGVCSLCNE